MGATFDDETRVWANKTGTIVAVKRAGDIDTMGLAYTLTDYAKFYEEQAAEAKKKAGPKL